MLYRFPGWHRIYLQQFELALQAADKANGNDGKIGLPYWYDIYFIIYSATQYAI